MAKGQLDLMQRVDLPTEAIPGAWYNPLPDLPWALPKVKDPDDGSPSRIEALAKIKVGAFQAQEESPKRWLDIPDAVMERYSMMGRPTPLYRARRLEEYLDTPARIYIKREDVSPSGSFKMNSSIPMAYYAKEAGFDGLVSETGAGQWGAALACGCSFFGLQSVIFMARTSYEQKPYRRIMTELYGGTIYPSPSSRTEAGTKILEEYPDHPGSIGSGISEAIEYSLTHQDKPRMAYVNGSNHLHVLQFQTIIGLEVKKQLEQIGENADTLVACVSGGSNLGGLMLPFLPEKFADMGSIKLLAAESEAAPRLTKGEYRYDFGDTAGLTPLALAYTLGHKFVPERIHAGGLRHHTQSPLIASLRNRGYLEAIAYAQKEAFEAGRLFAHLEGVVPAPETCHGVKALIDEALDAKKKKQQRTIVLGFSGHGMLDLSGYKKVLL